MGRRIDVCNGDADGLCALLQYRLARPAAAELITGLKREIGLLARVRAGSGDEIAVFDISLARNRSDLDRLLGAGASLCYFDHHDAGLVPQHARLEAHIDTSPTVCTGMLVDAWLGGRYRPWAVVCAFGDGLAEVARPLGRGAGLDAHELEALQALGEALNHNAYGESAADQLFGSAALFERIRGFEDPRDLLLDEPGLVAQLCARRHDDLQAAARLRPEVDTPRLLVQVLPAEAWSRRVTGSLANDLAQAHPGRRVVVALDDGRGGLRISLRVAREDPVGADQICRAFGGNGRVRAAGIDDLPVARWSEFIDRLGAD